MYDSQRLQIMCDGNFHKLIYRRLTKKTLYSIRAIWTSDQDRPCNLNQHFTTCKHSYNNIMHFFYSLLFFLAKFKKRRIFHDHVIIGLLILSILRI